MGTWGTGLYDNDIARDVRGDYIDGLRRGKDGKQLFQSLLDSYRDEPDMTLFWLSLADTQWEYGRLMPEVKSQALSLIEQGSAQNQWHDADAEKLSAWTETCHALMERLYSPQPSPKRVRPYRLYSCPWAIGDVYSYRLTGPYSQEKGFAGQYMIFRMVGTGTWWPGHTIPVVHFYKWIGDKVPSLEQLLTYDLLEVGFAPVALLKNPHLARKYAVGLITESAKDLPTEQLTYLGNIPERDSTLSKNISQFNSVGWENSKYNTWIEEYMIRRYLEWRNVLGQ